MRVVQPRQQRDLLVEPRRAAGGRRHRVEHLERHLAPVLAVVRQVHHRRRAPSELPHHAVPLGDVGGEAFLQRLEHDRHGRRAKGGVSDGPTYGRPPPPGSRHVGPQAGRTRRGALV
jgi:hypothetical protein